MRATQHNFLALSFGEIGSRIVGFAATALLARRLGADGFGILGLALAVTGYLVVPGLGLQDLAARELAKKPTDAARLVASVIRLRLLMSLGIVLAAAAIAAILPKPNVVRGVLALSPLILLPMAANASWAFKALERALPVAGVMLVSQLVYLAGVAVFVTEPRHILLVPIMQTIGEVAAALLLLPVTRHGWKASSLREGIEALRGGTLATASRYARSLTMAADVVLLSFLLDDRAVGLYSAAYRVVFLLMAIASSSHSVFIAPVTRDRDDSTRWSVTLSQSLWLSWTATLPLVIGGALVAPALMSLLFGDEFAAGALALQLLLVSVGLMAMHGAARNVLLARGRMDLDARVNAAVAAVNILLNVLLIPRYGIVASASVMVLSEAAMLLAYFTIIGRWGWMPMLRPLMRPLLSAAVMAAVLLGLPSRFPLLGSVAIGGAVYLAMLGLLGEIRRASATLTH